MKKLLVIILILAVCGLTALWSPWLNWNLNIGGLFGVERTKVFSGIQAYSLSGEVELFIDDQLLGTFDPETSPLVIDSIEAGEHLVSLKRISAVPNAYWEFSKLVTFETGAVTVTSFNLGPSEEFSEGHIIYPVEKIDQSAPTKVNIKANVSDFSVQIGNVEPQNVPDHTYTSNLSLGQQHKIIISKLGYERLEFVILPASQEERDKLQHYNLNVDVQLMLQPVNVE